LAWACGSPSSWHRCPHWGVLLQGEFRIPFTEGRVETVRAGDAYYLRPGHRFEVTKDCEYIEFSPTAELRRTYETVARRNTADPQKPRG
jgi:hypothetical protein